MDYLTESFCFDSGIAYGLFLWSFCWILCNTNEHMYIEAPSPRGPEQIY